MRMALTGGGRVKRRSQPITGQYSVAARTVISRRFLIHYLKGNRIADFRQGKGFSHGLGGERSLTWPCSSDEVAPAIARTTIEPRGSDLSGRSPMWYRSSWTRTRWWPVPITV